MRRAKNYLATTGRLSLDGFENGSLHGSLLAALSKAKRRNIGYKRGCEIRREKIDASELLHVRHIKSGREWHTP